MTLILKTDVLQNITVLNIEDTAQNTYIQNNVIIKRQINIIKISNIKSRQK